MIFGDAIKRGVTEGVTKGLDAVMDKQLPSMICTISAEAIGIAIQILGKAKDLNHAEALLRSFKTHLEKGPAPEVHNETVSG